MADVDVLNDLDLPRTQVWTGGHHCDVAHPADWCSGRLLLQVSALLAPMDRTSGTPGIFCLPSDH